MNRLTVMLDNIKQLFTRVIKKSALSICLLAFALSVSFAQIDYNKQYFSAKTLFREGKYNLAMEGFKPLVSYNANNRYIEYASFYYALSAYHQGYQSVAKDMFAQIKKLYPSWDKLEEVNFWLGKIHMDNREYFQGLKVWTAIKNSDIQKDIAILKPKYLSGIDDIETLRMMHEEHPNDAVVGRLLASMLSKNTNDQRNREQLEVLVKKFHLKRDDFIIETPDSFYKDVYSVSLLFPFMISTIEPTPSKKRNQLILDLYEGMQQAVDTLEKQGIKISLRAYDTERSSAKIKKLLETEELKNTDLIVGPFFPEENAIIQEFSLQNRINLFKPFTSNFDLVRANEFGFLFQPSYETLAAKSAEFVADNSKRRKTCMVIYGTSRKDSTMAAAFIQKAKERGLKILSSHEISKESTGKIINLIATPTEFDQWKNPIQFKLKKDSLGCVYVASDDPLIYTKVISSVETRADSVLIIGSETWLEQPTIDFDKYQAMGIVFPAPGFVASDNPHYKAFARKFVRMNGEVPSNYAMLGYDMMMFLGNSLKKYGVYFQQNLNKEKYIPGYLYEGYNYQASRDNQYVPFAKFKNGQLVAMGKKR